MRKIYFIFITLLFGCSETEIEPRYFLHKNCCYSVPVGIKIEPNKVSILSIEDDEGRKKIIHERTFNLTYISENLLEFHISDDSKIPNTQTYKYSDLNGIWELGNQILQSKGSEGHYYKREDKVLFYK